MATKSEWVMARAICLYHCNVEPEVWARDFNIAVRSKPWHPNYLDEKMRDFRAGFNELFGTLDNARKMVHLDLVLERYRFEAEIEYGSRYDGLYVVEAIRLIDEYNKEHGHG